MRLFRRLTLSGVCAGLILTFLLALSVPGQAQAATMVASGSCGASATYELLGSGNSLTLTISGSGAVYNYPEADRQPWHSYRSRIKTVHVNEGITFIGTGSLASMTAVTGVSLPKSLTAIGESAFSGDTSLRSVSLPGGLSSIGASAFSGCRTLTAVTIPAGVTSLGESAFLDCRALKTVTVGGGVTEIPDHCFAQCDVLEKVTLSNGLAKIGTYAFCNDAKLASVNLPATVTVIGESAFYGCHALKSVSFPSALASIGANAYGQCRSLTKISLPQTVTELLTGTFAGCDNLATVRLSGTLTKIHRLAFSNSPVRTVYYACNRDEWASVKSAFPSTAVPSFVDHAWGRWTKASETEHEQVCANNTAHTRREAHHFQETDRLEAGCETDGYVRWKCADCGAEKEEILPATGHDYSGWIDVGGITHFRVCAHDASHVETAAHTFGAGVTVRAASARADGEIRFTCSTCGGVRTFQTAHQVTGADPMYRLYYPGNHEHLYTKDVNERYTLVLTADWQDEGLGWYAPASSRTPVWRLYNPYSGDHHYTLDFNEYQELGRIGWEQEGIGWYSDDEARVPIWRQFSPVLVTGTHNYTADVHERDVICDGVAWIDEGVGWYGVAK